MAQCSADHYLAVNGQIVNAADGSGVDGVGISVVRRSGGTVAADSISTVTSRGGQWRVEFDPTGTGELVVDVIVAPAGIKPYRVTEVHLASSERRGDATILPSWVSNPYFNLVGEVFLRGTNDQRDFGTNVQFRRTGGVNLTGPGLSDGVYRNSSDVFGRFALFPVRGAAVFADGVGEVVGDLRLVLTNQRAIVVKTGVRLPSTYLYHAPVQVLRYAVGPSLDYIGEFYRRAGGARLAGVQVDFERTGGIAVETPRFSTVSDASGRFAFKLLPLTAGALEGRLIFRATVAATPETLQVSLTTFDDDAPRFYGVIAVGAYLPYYAILLRGGRGIDGVAVDVHRVSGIGTSPADFTVTSTNGGIVPIQPVPLALGEVIVDLTVRPPAPFTAFTIRNVRLSTADRTVADRLIGVFSVDAPPPASSSSLTR